MRVAREKRIVAQELSVMSESLSNRVALVTGGSTGIGRAVALQLAESGARVIITGRHEDTLRESASQHPNIGFLVADVAQLSDAGRTIDEVQRRYARLDILVNNAGAAAIVPLDQADPAHVRWVFDVNVHGLVETSRLALPLPRESKGTIVNVASSSADQPFPGSSVYSASKAAVVALTRSWGQELAEDGVRVNAVSPGPIFTAPYRTSGIPEQIELIERITLQHVPLKRFGTPEEVASVVVFLCSPAASFVTGAQYTVAGGLEA
jgi:NAD(P)-dependent dehydrogenase (short-subunit alcohol dehydrogenase family)